MPAGKEAYHRSMHDPQTLARLIEVNVPLFERFLEGFDEANRASQAPGCPNHVIWTLGHVSLTMHRMADRLRGSDEPGTLPESDFYTGDGRGGDRDRYDTEAICFGSTPSPQADRYPSLARGRQIFRDACARLREEAAGADHAKLARMSRWGSGEQAVGDLVMRVVLHNATHAGQLTDLRRGLGLKRVIG